MYIGIDAGGTNIRIASFNDFNTPIVASFLKMKNTNNYTEDIKTIINGIKHVVGENTVEGIGLGIPCILDNTNSIIVSSPHLSSWINQPLKNTLENEFNCTVKMQNDAITAALAEAYYGQGKNLNFSFVIWGTGVGGAIIKNIEGKVYPFASELGHQIIEWNGPQCSCGQKGCLDWMCAGGGAHNVYGKSPEEFDEEIWAKVEQRFAQGLINLIAINNSDLIIFGGGMAINNPHRVQNVRKIVAENLKIYKTPEFKVTEFEDFGGMYGALGLLKD